MEIQRYIDTLVRRERGFYGNTERDKEIHTEKKRLRKTDMEI